jgi:rod shape-determining protein MreD
MPGPWFRVPALVVATLFVHDAVLRSVRLAGVRPDLLLGLVVIGAIVGGPERGALYGFCAGIVADLFLPTPFGLSPLVWCIVGYGLGALQTTILPHGRMALPVVTLFASAAAEVGFALAGSTLGQPMIGPHLAVIVVVVALVNAVLSWPLARAVRWSLAGGATEGSFAS